MKRSSWLLFFLLAISSWVALAQTIPDLPSNPISFMMRALQAEAKLKWQGVVKERQLFPPRAEPEQTRAEIPAPPPLSPRWLRENFNSKAFFGENIAGRETWRIDLIPKIAGVPSFSIWLDRQYLVRLAVQERDADNIITYDARFTSLENKPQQRKDVKQLMKLEPHPKLEAFVQRETGLVLPAGFHLFDIRPRTVGKDNLNALEVRASNGISVLVMIFAPIGTGNSGKVVSRNVAGAFVWVIGNLLRPELERTAGSIRSPLNLGVLLSSFGQFK